MNQRKPRTVHTDPPVEIHPVTLSEPDANRSVLDDLVERATALEATLGDFRRANRAMTARGERWS